jgi:hypothetical protein
MRPRLRTRIGSGAAAGFGAYTGGLLAWQVEVEPSMILLSSKQRKDRDSAILLPFPSQASRTGVQ